MRSVESSSDRRSLLIRILAILALVCGLFVLRPLDAVHAAPVSPVAINVYGQGGSFTTATANKGGVSANSLNAPVDVAHDSANNLYIADTNNNRVLFYPSGSTTATRVYGQGGSFSTATANKGGISADSLNAPQGVAVDTSNNLYIADTNNSRVLFYAGTSTTATRVYGQGGDFTTAAANKGGISADSLNRPTGVVADNSNNLYIADTNNSRVLFYAGTSTTATRIYGQAGDFTTGTSNKGGISADSLNSPQGVTTEGSNLYIADTNNSRVLFYSGSSTTASRVYGQGSDFTTGTSNKGGISADSLNSPAHTAIDASSNVYIADTNNARVLFYAGTSTTATRVYGQDGDFTTATSNKGGISAQSMTQPASLGADSLGNLYVADVNNNRLLDFQNSLSVSTQLPTSVATDTHFTVAGELIDRGSGSAFSDFTGTVTVQITPGSGTAGAVLSGTTSVAAVGGVATFSDLSIDKVGNCYRLTLSTPGAASTQTHQFSVTGLATPAPCSGNTCTLHICLAVTGSTLTVNSNPTLIVNHGQTIPVINQDQFIPFSFLATVADLRGTAHGWTTAASATAINFAGGGSADLILADTFPIIATCTGGANCSSPSTLTLGSGGQNLVPGPVTLATASIEAGAGSYNIAANGTFLVPANVDANGYTGGVITMSITGNP
ncbi:hypothetical protein KDA_43040 [Dictyobacter alpinus]|uniref:SMP-30/Gluconolactonase/LRE-like region domain-containing protein n=1 Tax=Dictyobacter alpinus TaxID=2014873 RepID=A0A402BBZ3_9CHLR|nr:NHL repeat-containing protein [Dictyobacter alpinus]GCE28820.1 hypothetical protein KDA_43040 [Dictyobacter alpinus]